ncbi:penicillin-binding protein 2 [candidate division KSB1 bacterium]|nr:penicillin-binding protein 2 [candidate division KSB1 bacterium]
MNENENQQKALVFYVILTAVFLVILSRFFYLQIYLQEKYFEKSERNRVREIINKPLRGLIFDREKVILVDNKPAYSIYAIPFILQKADSIYPLLCNILTCDSIALNDKIKSEYNGLFQPVKLMRQVDFMTLAQIEEYKHQLPGISYQVEPKRCYPSGIKSSHLFGYLGEITARELEANSEDDYAPGDLIGKTGLEKHYESVLKGKKGVHFVEVDASGREIRSLTEKTGVKSVPGNHLILAMDAHLQRCLEEKMVDLRGGAVVIDVRNGDVLAMVSKPEYDLELFTKPIQSTVWRDLISDPEKPLYDRMIQSVYPPGSTYKLVLAAAALEEGIIDDNWAASCPGNFYHERQQLDCWKSGGHGTVTLLEAIEQSCNVYFYKLGLKTGLDTWAKYGRVFGFGHPTGVDIRGENSGLLPDKAYFDTKYGKAKWSDGLIVSLAIGQGDLLVTPLQMAVFAMILATEGDYFEPHLVKQVIDAGTGEASNIPLKRKRVYGVSEETFELIKQGMFRVIHGASGTGSGAYVPGIRIAGKTGTAQNPHGEAHAWFIGFAPVKNPEIAFCVLVENGGSGGAVAVPIAHALLRQYFLGED